MKRILLIEKNCDFKLENDEEGNLYFEVVCGTVSVYNISFILNSEETEAWKSNGEVALRHLSYLVRDWPEEYLKRRI
jgi:hypothetical protein